VKLQPIHYRAPRPRAERHHRGHINLNCRQLSLVSSSNEKKAQGAGVSSPKRVKELPNSPTVSETVPATGGTWFGLATTGRTPRDVVMKITPKCARSERSNRSRRNHAPQLFRHPMAANARGVHDYIKTEDRDVGQSLRDRRWWVSKSVAIANGEWRYGNPAEG